MLFDDALEFYATYKLENIKNHRIYTDKMWLSVVELNSIELATEEDRRYQIDQWARLFKAKTWEELKSMAMANQYMESAVNTIYELSVDETVQEQCRRWAEYEYYQKRKDEQIAESQQEITKLKQENADKDVVIADKDAEIAELKRKLAEALGEAWFWDHTNKVQLTEGKIERYQNEPIIGKRKLPRSTHDSFPYMWNGKYQFQAY